TARQFHLRDNSLFIAAMMALFGVLGLAVVPAFFARVGLAVRDGELEIRVGRWPLPPRRFVALLGAVRGFSLKHKTVMDQEHLEIFADVDGSPEGFNVGMAFQLA